MAKGKTPNPIEGPFDERLIQEYQDAKKLADERGGQYQRNLDVSYEPRSTLSQRLWPEITPERLMKEKGYSRELAEKIAKKLQEDNPHAGKGYKNMGEAVGDFVEGLTYLPRTAYYGYKDAFNKLRGKNVGEWNPDRSGRGYPFSTTAGEGADFQRRENIRLGIGRPEKIQYKKGGKVQSFKKGGKVRGAGIARKGTRPAKMR